MKSAADIRGFDFHCHVDLHREPTQCERERIITIAVTKLVDIDSPAQGRC